MKLTVLMPVYNAERYLKPALESILNQSYHDFEFLIIDDGSTDNSVNIIKSYVDPRIKLIVHQQNQKLISTLNEGINLARGEYIARMDADDISELNRLKIQMEFLENNLEIIVCGTDFKVINEQGKAVNYVSNPIQPELIKKYLAVQNPFCHGSVIFKKQAVLDAGGYDINQYLVEDYDLWVKMIRIGKLANIPQPLYYWRSLSTGESGTKWQLMNQNVNKLKYYYWQTFGSAGPMILNQDDNNLIANESALDNSKYRQKMLVLMHLFFADAYDSRKQFKIKMRHLFAALKLKSSIKYKLFILLAIFLPGGWITKAKNIPFFYKQIKMHK